MKRKSEESWDYRTPDEYWEARYREKIHGGKSGPGSVGENRLWKWQRIDRHLDISTKSVLDVGCGDLSFWEGKTCRSYVGLDFSPTIIERNFEKKPDWHFIQGDASTEYDVSGEVVFCFDMLFHIPSDDVYSRILRNLSKWTKEWLFIYTWHNNQFGDSQTDGKYQYYRPLMDSVDSLAPLELIDSEIQDEIGTLYIFKNPDVQ